MKKSTICKCLAVLLMVVFTSAISLSFPAKGSDDPEDYPFFLGAAKGAGNITVPLLDYRFGENPGSIPMDGSVQNLSLEELFAQYETRPDSLHPDGTAYFWVIDDADFVYFVADWTSDDTYDDGEDYFTVHIDDGSGLRSYTQHSDGGEYGVSVFGMTAVIDYEHMWYSIAVPKTDFSAGDFKVGFEMYGTAALYADLAWVDSQESAAVLGEPMSFGMNFSISAGSYDNNHIAFLFEYDSIDEFEAFLNGQYAYGDYKGVSDFYTLDYGGWVPGEGYPVTLWSSPGVRLLAQKSFTTNRSQGNYEESGSVTNMQVTFSTEGVHHLALLPSFGHYNYGLNWDGQEDFFPWNADYLVLDVTVSSTVFVGVTDISGVSDTAVAGTPLALSGTVAPANATNQSISWSIADAGSTGAAIIGGNSLVASSVGTVVLTASIADGLSVGSAFTKNFTVHVSDPTPVVYTVIQDFGTWSGSGNVTGKIDAHLDKFLELRLGNDPVDSSLYDRNEGSTVLILSEGFVDSLSVGNHAFRAIFIDGYADLLLSINEQTTESTTAESSDTTESTEPEQTSEPTTPVASTAPTSSVKPTEPSIPKTGDDGGALESLFLLIPLLLGIGVVGVWYKRKV